MKSQQLNLFGEVVETPASESIIIKVNHKRSQNLSKEQKQFNRLVKQIEKLNKDIETKEQLLEDTLSKFHTTIQPVKLEIAKLLIEYVKKIHNFLQKFKFTNAQERDLSGLIVNFLDSAFGAIEPDDELRQIYDEYSDEGTLDEIVGEDMASRVEDLIEMLEFEFGVEIDRDSVPDLETATPEDMERFIGSLHQKIREEHPEVEAEPFLGKETKRKATKAQQQKEIKEKAAKDLKNKSLRSLYLSLAKALHPDTGGTEEEIAQKEELMKQVTQAYEDKDLSSLLKLEITWLKGEVSHTASIADKQLKIYNEVLKEQVQELQQKEFSLASNPRFAEIGEMCYGKAKDIPVMFNQELESVKEQLSCMKQDFIQIKNKKTLLEFRNHINESAEQIDPFYLLDQLFDEDG